MTWLFRSTRTTKAWHFILIISNTESRVGFEIESFTVAAGREAKISRTSRMVAKMVSLTLSARLLLIIGICTRAAKFRRVAK
jgi:hypothetical protein